MDPQLMSDALKSPTDLGERVKLVRTDLNFSQSQFAKRLGVNRAHISRIESGKATPSKQLMRIIAQEYDVSAAWLREGKGRMEPGVKEQVGSGEIETVKCRGESYADLLALAFLPVDNLLRRIEIKCKPKILDLVQAARLCWDWAANIRAKTLIDVIEKRTGPIEILMEGSHPFNHIRLPIRGVRVQPYILSAPHNTQAIFEDDGDNEILFDLVALAFSTVLDILRRIEPECEDDELDLVLLAELFWYRGADWTEQIIEAVDKETGRVKLLLEDYGFCNSYDLPVKGVIIYPKGMNWPEIHSIGGSSERDQG